VRSYVTYHKKIALMIVLKYAHKVQPRKNEDSAKIIMVKNHHDALLFN